MICWSFLSRRTGSSSIWTRSPSVPSEASRRFSDCVLDSKDYYDLFELHRALAFEGSTLVEAIRRTFARRGRLIPAAPLEGLTEAFAAGPVTSGRWHAFLGKNQVLGSEPDFATVVAAIRRFAQPVLDAARDQQAFVKSWPPGGPWS